MKLFWRLVFGIVVLSLLVTGQSVAPDITGDVYAQMTGKQAVKYIETFATLYADNYDQATARRIKDHFNVVPSSDRDFPIGVVEALAWADKVLRRKDPKTVSMYKVFSYMIEVKFGKPSHPINKAR